MFVPVVNACHKVLQAGSLTEKVTAAHEAVAILKVSLRDIPVDPAHKADPNQIQALQQLAPPPNRPARPERPVLVAPNDVPRRRLGSQKGRAALLHAVAHIEFNAIDMAFDMAARFAVTIAQTGLDLSQFLRDWITVGGEEALHFSLVNKRLADLGTEYGDLPSHDGLWEAAQNTNDSLLARLAIAPMVLEARGLDVTPGMIEKFKKHGDLESAAILQRIYDDEIGHVATGARWFRQICALSASDPASTFQHLVRTRFHGELKEPFNHEARQKAGIELAFYREWMTPETV